MTNKYSRVVVEFRLVGATHESSRYIGRIEMPCVPALGELVNVDGHPYVAHRRSWALSTGEGEEDWPPFCYIDLVSHHGQPPLSHGKLR